MTFIVSELQGVDNALAAKLKELGLNGSDMLLSAAATPQQRKELAAQTGAKENTILELANRADLARIKGIGQVYSDLLEFAGVDTVVELGKRVPENLHKKIAEVAAQHSVQRLPRLADIENWIAQAKSMDRAIQY